MINKKIVKRIYVKGQLKNVSPLLIGCGSDEQSDSDIVRDSNGNLMIPGTSIAGVLRAIVGNEDLFGGTDDKSLNSPFKTYHAVSKHKVSTIRDNVHLKYETKTAKDGGKFDYEIIEPGAEFDFRLELLLRQDDSKEVLENSFWQAVTVLKDGHVALGAKTTRGLGKVVLEDMKALCLDMTCPADVEKWIEFDWDGADFNSPLELVEYSEGNLHKIECDFTIDGSVLIRAYNSSAEGSDSIHLSYKGNKKDNQDKEEKLPIISGTSWAGFFRHTCWDLLKEIGKPDDILKDILDELFGTVEGDKKKKSRIRFSESRIEGGELIPYTRNKIDRFTGGTASGALFTNDACYGGKVRLTISIKDAKPYEIGLIELALKDICLGLRAIGGETGVGRGTLSGEYEPKNEYLKSLAEYGAVQQ